MSLQQEIIQIIEDVLIRGNQQDSLDQNSGLMGAIPEFDSVAVVSLITAIEEEFGCTFDDDELNADVFASVGSLTQVVEHKLN